MTERGGRIYYVTPSLMTGGLLLGALSAVAHHLFYNSPHYSVVASQSHQQWSIRIGTVLAFLVRTCLVASAGLAYTQLLWYTLRSRSVTLGGIDSLFDVTTNLWALASREVWVGGLVIPLTALVLWSLPLVALVTPSTLTVQLDQQPNASTISAPVPSIEYGRYGSFADWSHDTGWVSPSYRLSTLLSTVASGGSILPIAAPYPNSSYTLEFFGPTLSCGEPSVNASALQDLVQHYDINNGLFPLYVGFVPSIGFGDLEAHVLSGLNATLYPSSSSFGTADGDFNTIYDHARLYLVITQSTVVECGLYNSSYIVNFSFNNGHQDIQIKNISRLNGVFASFSLLPCEDAGVCNSESYDPATVAYMGIMVALGDLVVGELFQSSWSGAVYLAKTKITSTVLMQAIEMQGLGQPSPLSIANMTLSEAMEQVVVNATLSLFSDSFFLQNSTSAAHNIITIFSPQNIYKYDPFNLFLAYGVGILSALAITVIGLACIWTSSNCYSNAFSTILRTTRSPELDAAVTPMDTQGTEPMPKSLAQVRVIFHQRCIRPEPGEDQAAFKVIHLPGAQKETPSPALAARWSLDSLLLNSSVEEST
ncbi:hypothetical protein F4680DRAFT_374515 [Xylaria scruposa]|nr:hypothetical protein F4680DRAFT_374515 [Xylaria scruposa]